MRMLEKEHSLSIEIHNDLGCPIGGALWWDKTPTFVSVTLGEGRLLRPEIKALRDYCDMVLARMDATAQQKEP